jgi:hypothetical protein
MGGNHDTVPARTSFVECQQAWIVDARSARTNHDGIYAASQASDPSPRLIAADPS